LALFAEMKQKKRLTSGALCRNNPNQSDLTSGALYAGMAVFFNNRLFRKNIKYQL